MFALWVAAFIGISILSLPGYRARVTSTSLFMEHTIVEPKEFSLKGRQMNTQNKLLETDSGTLPKATEKKLLHAFYSFF